MVMPSSASFLFYVGPLNQFSSFSYALLVHIQGNASFNVLYVTDLVFWPLRVKTDVECSIRLSSAPRGKPRGLCANLRPPRPSRLLVPAIGRILFSHASEKDSSL